uniref:Putative secreted protein n=1 Tax=Rhipicephalus microplus TaxID=6941 RepID=A0A6G5A2E3_RHIMP
MMESGAKHSSVHSFLLLSVHASVCVTVHVSICPCVHLFVGPSLRSSMHPPLRPFMRPSMHLSVCPFVHLFNTPSTTISHLFIIYSAYRSTAIQRTFQGLNERWHTHTFLRLALRVYFPPLTTSSSWYILVHCIHGTAAQRSLNLSKTKEVTPSEYNVATLSCQIVLNVHANGC